MAVAPESNDATHAEVLVLEPSEHEVSCGIHLRDREFMLVQQFVWRRDVLATRVFRTLDVPMAPIRKK
jgi:hypothetical protein